VPLFFQNITFHSIKWNQFSRRILQIHWKSKCYQIGINTESLGAKLLNMLIRILLFGMLIGFNSNSFATGEPSTYFQIFVPPNNDAVKRDAALIITALYDSTSFEIIDDGMDGDTDDSKKGMLMAGQSYVLYIRDNGINDDARYASGGVLKWDGDYFIVKSDKLMFASQSTNSDWQHDWVPSTDKKSIGNKFILYSPQHSNSKRDVNVFAYEPNTTVTFQKISTQAKINSGYTDVNFENPQQIFTRVLNPGEDLINHYQNGRDVMEAGETYVILADKPVTVQYGSLFINERDGGGYVPSSNGSSSGELFYFVVPFQSAGEQEIRIASWDDQNDVQLDRYVNGQWVAVKSFKLSQMKAGDWVGKNDGNVSYLQCFRVKCTTGKKVSVFEGNWFETGAPGTSDMATMVSSENGSTAGKRFLTYMAPPGNEHNVTDPFTGKAFGQQLTHLYIFSKNGATATVKDAYSNGTKFKKTYTIKPERYIDCALTLAEWKSIYNGTGSNTGAERPYLIVESDAAVAVMNTNFNDNWMAYTGTSLLQGFTESSESSMDSAIPGDTLVVKSTINTGSTVTDAKIEVIAQDGLKVLESVLITPSSGKIQGDVDPQPLKTIVTYDNLEPLTQKSQYIVETIVVAGAGNNTGDIISKQNNSTIETVITGKIDGQIQQATSIEVININSANTSQLIFSKYSDNLINRDSTDSWTTSWVDINKDGYDDVFVTDRRSNRPNLIYMNNKTGGFNRGQSLMSDTAVSMSNTWADLDNDGYDDLLVMNNTRKTNTFYRNNKGTLTRDNSKSFTQNISYYHGGAFADYDNDGKVDLFLCNYFPTRYNELHHNNDNSFTQEMSSVIPMRANQSVGPSWADYDGDGFQDLFVPNGNGFKNSLFHNEGNGRFTDAQNIVGLEGGQSVGGCWGDFDNDKDLDLYVANSSGLGNFLYRNLGNGQFERITEGIVVTDKVNAHGCSFADIDNDGDLDLYVSNDKNFKRLYINDGLGNFTAKEDELVVLNFGNAFGHAWSDYDHDGDLDLFVATHSNQPNAFFTNNGNKNNWFQIKLESTTANRSAIGAVVYILSNGIWQMREVNAQSGFGGQSSLTQHFGLGSATKIDSVIVKWPGGQIQYIDDVTINEIFTAKQTASIKISGGVYFDANRNCIKEENETTVSRAGINLLSSGSKVFTNNDGTFTVNLAPGSHTFEIAAEGDLKKVCEKPVTINITGNEEYNDTLWIAAEPICAASDPEIIMGGTAIRKGFSNNNFKIAVTNNGRKSVAGVVVRWKAPVSIIPSDFNIPFSSMEISNDDPSYKVYTWKLNDLKPFSSEIITFTHSNSALLTIGDKIVITGSLEFDGEDCKKENNAVEQVYTVVGAIDPNDLQVSPAGYGSEGFVLPTQTLSYTVRFQNKGNHPAMSVSIFDELPAGLNANSLKVIATSHPEYNTSIKGNHVVFHFDNIFLPDSLSHPAGSNGFITFSVEPVQKIAAGTRIINKAFIQFDHYKEIETNEVLNSIQSVGEEESLISIQAYPNPAADVLYVSLKHKMGNFTERKIAGVELVDMLGRVQMSQSFSAGSEVRLDLPIWLNGFYIVKITDTQGNIYTKKLLVRKTK
jgi:uncharacterized repeat protein (TIGR01451 family)